MRVGDVYKIRTLINTGSTDEEIFGRFGNDYAAAEIEKFITEFRGATKPATAAAPRTTRRSNKSDG